MIIPKLLLTVKSELFMLLTCTFRKELALVSYFRPCLGSAYYISKESSCFDVLLSTQIARRLSVANAGVSKC